MSSEGHTEVIIGVSEAKLHEEADFDIQKSLAPQKPGQKTRKTDFRDRKKNPKKKVSKNQMWGIV